MNLNEMTHELGAVATRVGADLWLGGRNVLLAGLGLTGTMIEGVRESFDSLVEKGRSQDLRPERLLTETTRRVDDTVAVVRSAGARSQQAVQSATTAVLERLGVPSRREVHKLIDRVERLNAKLATMGPLG